MGINAGSGFTNALPPGSGASGIASVDSSVNTSFVDVIGNKNDTTSGDSIVSLIKNITTSSGDPLVNSVDSAANVNISHVIGNKNDTTSGTSIISLEKQILSSVSTTNANLSSVAASVSALGVAVSNVMVSVSSNAKESSLTSVAASVGAILSGLTSVETGLSVGINALIVSVGAANSSLAALIVSVAPIDTNLTNIMSSVATVISNVSSVANSVAVLNPLITNGNAATTSVALSVSYILPGLASVSSSILSGLASVETGVSVGINALAVSVGAANSSLMSLIVSVAPIAVNQADLMTSITTAITDITSVATSVAALNPAITSVAVSVSNIASNTQDILNAINALYTYGDSLISYTSAGASNTTMTMTVASVESQFHYLYSFGASIDGAPLSTSVTISVKDDTNTIFKTNFGSGEPIGNYKWFYLPEPIKITTSKSLTLEATAGGTGTIINGFMTYLTKGVSAVGQQEITSVTSVSAANTALDLIVASVTGQSHYLYAFCLTVSGAALSSSVTVSILDDATIIFKTALGIGSPVGEMVYMCFAKPILITNSKSLHLTATAGGTNVVTIGNLIYKTS